MVDREKISSGRSRWTSEESYRVSFDVERPVELISGTFRAVAQHLVDEKSIKNGIGTNISDSELERFSVNIHSKIKI